MDCSSLPLRLNNFLLVISDFFKKYFYQPSCTIGFKKRSANIIIPYTQKEFKIIAG